MCIDVCVCVNVYIYIYMYTYEQRKRFAMQKPCGILAFPDNNPVTYTYSRLVKTY